MLDETTLANAVAALCEKEPRFASVVQRHGIPSLRRGPEGLEGLLLIVTEQFLSLAAARAIWLRVEARLQPLTPNTVIQCADDELLALGLSRAKVKSFKGIAEAFANNTIDTQTLRQRSDDDARKSLLALPGIGPWSADIYLLSSLLRPDAWPVGDLALQAAAQNLFRLRERPTSVCMTKLGHALRPHRAVAARLLWSHYRDLKSLPQAP